MSLPFRYPVVFVEEKDKDAFRIKAKTLGWADVLWSDNSLPFVLAYGGALHYGRDNISSFSVPTTQVNSQRHFGPIVPPMTFEIELLDVQLFT